MPGDLSLLSLILAAFAGYMLGAIPFGLLLTRMAGLGDIRAIGSGNIGATNVLRTGRKGLALATLLLDGAKGSVAVLAAAWIDPKLALIGGFCAFLGHLFPIWLGFKGGKGVATALGTLIVIDWMVGLGACVTWVLVAALFRYSSLSSLAAIGAAPLYALLLGDINFAVYALLVAGLVWVRHRENILRLVRGTETKIGQKKPD
jgi:acyl phosphate:glycerol-3-phosphate acyltransferase